MYIDDFIWLPDVVDKIESKHKVRQDEVEEVFFNVPKYRFIESGYRQSEDVYSASSQTDAGRYLPIFFIYKKDNTALILSARDMDKKERKGYEQNEDTQITSISKASTIEEIADFWDTHSLADYWDQTHEVEFEVRAMRRHRVTLAPEFYTQIESQARRRGILPETLVNLWLIERLQQKKHLKGEVSGLST